jgi:SRSO17 transposase
METDRTIANIGRKTEVPKQNMHHFVSNSPWSGSELLAAIQADVRGHPEFQSGAMLILDESAEEKDGDHTAGAGRQHNGRLGKVEMSQVGVFLSLATPRAHTWVDGALYLPAHWFGQAYAARREKAGIPEDRVFRTKPELGWQMIERVVFRPSTTLRSSHHG